MSSAGLRTLAVAVLALLFCAVVVLVCFGDDGPVVRSCKAQQTWTVLVDARTCKPAPKGAKSALPVCKEKQIEDWEVTCSVTVGGQLRWQGSPPMAHPATHKQAFATMEAFLDKETEAKK